MDESERVIQPHELRSAKLADAIIGCAFAITETLEKNPFTEEEMETIIQNHTNADGETNWQAVSDYMENHTAAAVGQAVLNLVEQK